MPDTSDERPLGNPSLQNELAAYRKALQEEWEQENLSDPENRAALVEKARKEIAKAIPRAIVGITDLAENADNENVRLNAQKFIITTGIGETGIFSEEDPITALVKQLSTND